MKINHPVKVITVVFALIVGTYIYAKKNSYPSKFEITNESQKIKSSAMQDFSGSVMVNLDDDLDLEIFIAGHGSSNLFLKLVNNELVPIAIPELVDSKGLAFAITACDFNQDGRDELLLINRPSKMDDESYSHIFKYSEGKWIDLISKNDAITEKLNHGYSATCIDRKGDGKYGVAIASEDGKISYLEMINSKITDIASDIGIDLVSKGRSILGVPGSNGFTNIFVGNEKENFYFINDGTGKFKEMANAVGLSDQFYSTRGISLIDLNNDEILDIAYGNEKGPTRLFEQSRDGKFKEVTPEIMLNAYAVSAAVAGDFNLDGFEDLYLNNIRGHNKLFSRFEDKWYELDRDILEEKDLKGISTIASDIDKNGSFEILNTHGDNTPAQITLYSIKPSNSWIKFKAKYPSGTIPRGMVVVLRTNLRIQVRAITSGSGRFANYDDEVLFGLMKDEVPQSAEFILPSSKRGEFVGDLKLQSTIEITLP